MSAGHRRRANLIPGTVSVLNLNISGEAQLIHCNSIARQRTDSDEDHPVSAAPASLITHLGNENEGVAIVAVYRDVNISARCVVLACRRIMAKEESS